MAGLGTLPSSGSILGNSPGASNQKRRPGGAGGQPKPAAQPGAQQAAPQQPSTFSELQQQGRARPAQPQAAGGSPLHLQQGAPIVRSGTSPGMGGPPPQQEGMYAYNGGGGQPVQGQLQGAVSKALAAPSRYDLPEVQKVRDALTGQITQQFGASRKKLEEDLARRGLSASTIGGGYYGDLQGQEDTALAGMNAQLIQNQASTNAADLSASLGAGQNYVNSQNSNDLASRSLDLQGELGRGNLGVAQGQLGLGEKSLAQSGSQFDKSLAQSGSQFDRSQGLAEKLGVGGLDLQRQGLAQSGSQFDRSLAQTGSQFDRSQGLAERLGLGGLGIQQGQLDLARTGQAQQYGLQQGELTGSYNGQQTLAARGQGIQSQQFQDQLAQALGIATMGDRTANRAVDANAALAQNDMMMKVMALLQQYGVGGGGTPAGGGAPGGGGGTPTDPNAKPAASDAMTEWQRQNPGKPMPNPTGKEFTDWVRAHPSNTWGQPTNQPGGTTTVNYGGQQYTPEQWKAYLAAHPEVAAQQNGGAPPSGGTSIAPGGPNYSRSSTGSTMPNVGFSGGTPSSFRTAPGGGTLGASAGQGFRGGSSTSSTGSQSWQPNAGASQQDIDRLMEAARGGTYLQNAGGNSDAIEAASRAENARNAQANSGSMYRDFTQTGTGTAPAVSNAAGQQSLRDEQTRDATDAVNGWHNAGALFSGDMGGMSLTGPDGRPVNPGGSLQDMIRALLAQRGY